MINLPNNLKSLSSIYFVVLSFFHKIKNRKPAKKEKQKQKTQKSLSHMYTDIKEPRTNTTHNKYISLIEKYEKNGDLCVVVFYSFRSENWNSLSSSFSLLCKNNHTRKSKQNKKYQVGIFFIGWNKKRVYVCVFSECEGECEENKRNKKMMVNLTLTLTL